MPVKVINNVLSVLSNDLKSLVNKLLNFIMNSKCVFLSTHYQQRLKFAKKLLIEFFGHFIPSGLSF